MDSRWTRRISNLFFAIPSVAQVWAWLKARHVNDLLDLAPAIPFSALDKPLSESKFALVTTGGVHLVTQRPFDMSNPHGDASYRVIPVDFESTNITITHDYYEHSDADADLNVVFPLDHFKYLVTESVIGELAPHHYAFMGHIDGPLQRELIQDTAPAVADQMVEEGVDCVFLTPA